MELFQVHLLYHFFGYCYNCYHRLRIIHNPKNLFHNLKTFGKSMTLKDFIKYKVDDDFAYLVIESCNYQFYWFNPRNKEEKYQATNIVRNSDWYVVGWKVSRELPSWVKHANYWTDEIVEKNIIEENAKKEDIMMQTMIMRMITMMTPISILMMMMLK